MNKILIQIINWGIPDNADDQQKRKHILFNQVNLVIACIFVIFIIADFVDLYLNNSNISLYLLENTTIIFFCVLHIFLHKLGYFRLSISIFLLDSILLLLFAPLLAGKINIDLYIWGPFAPAFASIAPYFFFTEKKDLKLRNFYLALYLIIIISYDFILRSFSFSNSTMNAIIKDDIIFYKLAPIVAYFFVNLSLFYSTNLSRTLYDRLIESHKTLESINKSLVKVNTDKSVILSIMGHDLKNTMSSSIQLCDVLQNNRDGIDSNRAKKIIHAMKMSGEKGLHLLTELVEWSKLHSKSIKSTSEIFNLKSTVNQSIDLLAISITNKNIKLINNIEINIEIFANKKMIEVVIRNLISNAIKFSHRNGEITISAIQTKTLTQVCVEDNGLGIEKDCIDKIFSNDHSKIKKGTNNEIGYGLGLTFCKDFIISHQGKIWVESELGKGSRFYFTVPMVP